jgi:hypothetical protein
MTTHSTSSGSGGFDPTGGGGDFGVGGDFGIGGDFGVGGDFGDDGGALDGAGGGCGLGATSTFELSDLNWIGTPVNGLGPVERDTSNGQAAAGDGGPMSIAGMGFAKGLGAHANSSIEFDLGGKCRTFTSFVGADDEVTGASITFEVWVDGKRAYSSPGLVRSGQAAAFVSVDVSCASNLRLVVTDGVVDGNANDHADWAEAKVTCVSRPGGALVDAAVDRRISSGDDAARDAVDEAPSDGDAPDATARRR